MTPTSAPPTLDELHALDPAPPTPLTSAQVARRDALLVRVTSAEHPVAPALLRSTRRRIAVGLTATAALALVAAIVVSAVPGLTRAPISSYALPAHGSLASWTPQTTAATYTPDDVKSCVAQLDFSASNQVPVVLTSDKRGDFTSLFVEQGSNDGYCVMAGGEVENSTNFESLASHPLNDPNAADISVMQGGSWMFVVSGHSGGNVTSLTVKNPETGANVTATVARGVWSAWWPVGPDSKAWKSESQNEDYVHAISITYSTVDGQSHDSSSIAPGDDQLSDAAPAGQPVLSELPGWSAETQAVVPSAADVDTCAHNVDGWPSGSATTLLAETRGDFESLLLQRSGVDVSCVLKSGVVQWSTDTGHMTTDPIAADSAAYTQESGFDGIDGSTRITQMQGQAGPDVKAVTVHLAGGHDVQAVVQNGAWMAWWPENEPPALGDPTPQPTDGSATTAPVPAGPPAFSWTTTDGVTHDSQ